MDEYKTYTDKSSEDVVKEIHEDLKQFYYLSDECSFDQFQNYLLGLYTKWELRKEVYSCITEFESRDDIYYKGEYIRHTEDELKEQAKILSQSLPADIKPESKKKYFKLVETDSTASACDQCAFKVGDKDCRFQHQLPQNCISNPLGSEDSHWIETDSCEGVWYESK